MMFLPINKRGSDLFGAFSLISTAGMVAPTCMDEDMISVEEDGRPKPSNTIINRLQNSIM
jgi:hypothetical protein